MNYFWGVKFAHHIEVVIGIEIMISLGKSIDLINGNNMHLPRENVLVDELTL